jgi:hypothetical protein
MKQYDGPIRKLRPPDFEVVPYGLVGVQPVNMQQIDGAIAELGDRLVKRHAQQGGKTPVQMLVVLRDRLKDVLAVMPGLIIANPGIHGITLRCQAIGGYGLAEGKIRIACMRAEFNQQTRRRLGD